MIARLAPVLGIADIVSRFLLRVLVVANLGHLLGRFIVAQILDVRLETWDSLVGGMAVAIVVGLMAFVYEGVYAIVSVGEFLDQRAAGIIPPTSATMAIDLDPTAPPVPGQED